MLQSQELTRADVPNASEARSGWHGGADATCCWVAAGVALLTTVFWTGMLHLGMQVAGNQLATGGLVAIGCGIFAFVFCICSNIIAARD